MGNTKRIDSYFYGTELASSGLPEGQELQILDTVRDKVPSEVFTQPYTNSGRRQIRKSRAPANLWPRGHEAPEGLPVSKFATTSW